MIKDEVSGRSTFVMIDLDLIWTTFEVIKNEWSNR